MEDDIKEEPFFEESRKEIKIKEEIEDSVEETKDDWEEWTKEECEDPKDEILNNERAVDVRKIKVKEEIYAWNSFEGAEGSSKDTLTEGKVVSVENQKILQERIIFKPVFRSSELNAHIIQNGERSLECKICMKQFTHGSNLKVHMRSHTGEKRHECDVCKKKFVRGAQLKVHMRIHTGEKPYECELCDKKFAQIGSLKFHMISHTGEKPFECEVCKKTFTQRSRLNLHTKIHTGE